MEDEFQDNLPFLTHFEAIDDPRLDHNKRYSLIEILFVAVSAVLCGANHCVAIAEFADYQLEWLRKFVPLKTGAPSHDTISRVLSLIRTDQLEKCFTEWVQTIERKTSGEVIAIDGKRIRGSYDRYHAQDAIHMVSAWATENGVSLGQIKTDSKSNEITAIPKLLEMLDIKERIVTVDSMGTQKEIARQIINQGGDYVMALKGNHPNLHADIRAFFERNLANRFFDGNADIIAHDYFKTVEKDHGRIETRECWCSDNLSDIDGAKEWENLKKIVFVRSTRQIVLGETTSDTRCYITSLSRNAAFLLKATRSHWAVENSLHWVLDVGFGEDDSRTRKKNGPQIKSALNKIAINLCKINDPTKTPISHKRRKADWKPDFREQLLFGKT
jgi:predicted transposase YbfD/YdcC